MNNYVVPPPEREHCKLFHMTHLENVASILFSGLLARDRVNKLQFHEPQYIGDSGIIKQRRSVKVFHQRITEFVPLYWVTRTPMQYRLTSGPSPKITNEKLAFLVYKASHLDELDVFTADGNAAVNGTEFYRGWGAWSRLDWRILRANNCVSPEWKRKKHAEVLVLNCIPPEILPRICVYSEDTKTELEMLLIRFCNRVVDWEIECFDRPGVVATHFTQKILDLLGDIQGIQVTPKKYALSVNELGD